MSNFIEIGKVTGLHGFRGSVIVHTASGKDSLLSSLKQLSLGKNPSYICNYPVTESAWMPRGWKITLAGVNDEKESKKLVGHSVFARKEDFPTPDRDSFYHHHILGSQVWDLAKQTLLGHLKEIIPIHTSQGQHIQDRWQVELVTSEIIDIPANKRYVAKVLPDEGKIWVQNIHDFL